MAPEILKLQNYDHSVDIWTLGVLLFELFHNIEPFQGDDPAEVLTAIRSKQLKYESNCPMQAQELIKFILNVDSKARPSIEQIKAHPFLKGDVTKYSTPAYNQPAKLQAAMANGSMNGSIQTPAKETPYKQNGISQQKGLTTKPAFFSPTSQPIAHPASIGSASNNKISSSVSHREIYSQPQFQQASGGLYQNGGTTALRSEIGQEAKPPVYISSTISHRVMRTVPLQEQANGRHPLAGSQQERFIGSPSNNSRASPEISISPENHSRANFPFNGGAQLGHRKELSLVSNIQSVGQATPPRAPAFEQPDKPAPITIRGTHYTATVHPSPQMTQWNQEVLQQTRSPAPYDIFDNHLKQRSPQVLNSLRSTSYTVVAPNTVHLQQAAQTPSREDPKSNRLRTTEYNLRPSPAFESPNVSEFRPTPIFARPPQAPIQVSSNSFGNSQPISIRSDKSSPQPQMQMQPQVLNQLTRISSGRHEPSTPIAAVASQPQLVQRPALLYQQPQPQPQQAPITIYSGNQGVSSNSYNESASETRTIRSATSGPAFGNEILAVHNYPALQPPLRLYSQRPPEPMSATTSPIQKFPSHPSAVMSHSRPASQTFQPLAKPDLYSPQQSTLQQKAFSFQPQTQSGPVQIGSYTPTRTTNLQYSPQTFTNAMAQHISSLSIQQPSLQPIRITSTVQPSQAYLPQPTQPATGYYDIYGGHSSTSARVLRG